MHLRAVPCGVSKNSCIFFDAGLLELNFSWFAGDQRPSSNFRRSPSLVVRSIIVFLCTHFTFSSSDFHCCLPFHQHKRSSSMWAHLTLNEYCCVHLYAHRESRYCMVMHLWMRKKVENKMKKNTELWYIFFDLVQNWIFHSKIHTDTLTSVYALWHCDAV